MSNSSKGKKNEKALVVEPAAVVEQSPVIDVESQVEPQGEAALNEVEEMKLAEFEHVIEENINRFLLVGKALSAIRDGKLYRAKFTTFEDYCHERWGIGDKYAYRLIEAYTCDKNLRAALSPTGEIAFPRNESQVRPLTALEPDQQVKAWKQVVKVCKDKPLTAVEVEEVVNNMLGKSGKKDTTQPKSSTKKVEQTLVRIGDLVAKALDQDDSKLTIPGLKKILEKIQKMIETKK